MRKPHSSLVLSALYFTNSALARDRELRPREEISKYCLVDYTYGEITDPRNWGLVYHQLDATVSSGELCCDLCIRSTLNCIIAKFDKETGNCAMTINEDSEGLSEPQLKEEEVCTLGVIRGGAIIEKMYDWDHYWIGPCFRPVDLSCGVNIPYEYITDEGTSGLQLPNSIPNPPKECDQPIK